MNMTLISEALPPPTDLNGNGNPPTRPPRESFGSPEGYPPHILDLLLRPARESQARIADHVGSLLGGHDFVRVLPLEFGYPHPMPAQDRRQAA